MSSFVMSSFVTEPRDQSAGGGGISEYAILLFYHYYPEDRSDGSNEGSNDGTQAIVVAEEELVWHQNQAQRLKFGGRIRVSEEGINGVLSGTRENLQNYAKSVEDRGRKAGWLKSCIDWKFGSMRSDLPIEEQTFEEVKVEVCKEVVSLLRVQEQQKGRKGRRKGRRKKGKGKGQVGDEKGGISGDGEAGAQEQPQETPVEGQDRLSLAQTIPNKHLSPSEWHSSLLSPDPDTVILDTRNCYESSIGFFKSASSSTPTVLSNTRKFSDLNDWWDGMKAQVSGKNVLMYCTGGVRCEVASKSLISWSRTSGANVKSVGQLKGGICRYLEAYGEDGLYKGKNFVFDPRRFDPQVGKGVVGRCLVCKSEWDDYDNGRGTKERGEARCIRCRVLVLCCSECRAERVCFGEGEGEGKTKLFCGEGGGECVDMGNRKEGWQVVEDDGDEKLNA